MLSMDFSSLDSFLSRRSPLQIWMIGMGLVACVGGGDYLTGFELSFSIFYVVPVALVTWYVSTRAGYLACFFSAMVWFGADHISGHSYSYTFIPFWNATVRLLFFFLAARMIGGMKTFLSREQHLARTDDLTRIFNARAFKSETRRLLTLAGRHHRSLSLGYIDLDNFKSVNDNQGHSEGDRVLCAVADTLAKTLRSTDVVGRLGGDEFAVLMPETGLEAAQTAFHKIHTELVILAETSRWPVGFSIGVAVFTKVPASIDDAITVADNIMYRVKTSGKNRVLIEEYNAEEEP